jgi:hypothetical protein
MKILLSMNRLPLGASWTAPAERSGDGAFGRMEMVRISVNRRAGESGVALRLPPQSKTRSELRRLMAPRRDFKSSNRFMNLVAADVRRLILFSTQAVRASSRRLLQKK